MAPEVALGAEDVGENSFAAISARVKARDASRQVDQIKGSSRIPRNSDLARKIRANQPSRSDLAAYEAGGSQPLNQSGGGFRAGHSVRAARAASNVSLPSVNSVATPTGRGGIVMRLVVALGVAIVALEVASYVSGRYFTYDLKSGGAKLQDAGTYLGLYPGQQAKLQAATAAAQKPAVAAAATPYVSHGVTV